MGLSGFVNALMRGVRGKEATEALVLPDWMGMLKKAASWVISKVTGNTPLLLGNALAHPIHSLTQYGKCVQSGTPTPDAPQDIVCNNGAIKARRQSGLPLAYQMVEWLKPTGTIAITGFKTKSTQEIETVFYREQSGASYLYSSDTNTSGTTNTTAYLTSGAGNWRWDGKSYSIAVSTGIRITSVQNKDGVWLNGTRTGWYSDAGEFVSNNDLSLSSNSNTSVRIYSMTIREGETVTLDLVPVQRISDSAYGFYDKVSGNFYTNDEATFAAGDPVDDPVEIYADGTPEVLTVSGKNLFNKSTADANLIYGYFASSGRTWTYADAAFSIRIPCKPNTAYTARYNGSSTQAVLGFGSTANDDVPDGNHRTVTVTQGVRQSSPTINTPITITTGANDKWLIVAYNYANPQHTDMQDNLQVEQGSTPTAYEPYVTPQTVTVPMLLGVGDYKDTAELISGLLTHKVGIKVFDGTESWTKGTIPSSNYYYGGDTALDSNAENELICNQFAVGTRNAT